jgi:hypothetical protein
MKRRRIPSLRWEPLVVCTEIVESEARFHIREDTMDTGSNDGDAEAGLRLRTTGTGRRQHAIVVPCFLFAGGAARLGATRIRAQGICMVLAATRNRVVFVVIPEHRSDSLHRAATTIRAYDETEDDLQDNSDADHGRTAIVGQPNKQDSLKTIRCRRGQVTIDSLKNLAGEPPFRRWGATKLLILGVFHNPMRERGVDFRFHEPEALADFCTSNELG